MRWAVRCTVYPPASCHDINCAVARERAWLEACELLGVTEDAR